MKAKDLAKELMEHPDFEVYFMFDETKDFIVNKQLGVDQRVFKDVCIGDVGHSSQLILLDGTE